MMNKTDYRDMWVYIEHDGNAVYSVSLELCCEVRKLCDKSGDGLVAVIAGALPDSELQKIKDCGVDGLLLVSGTGYDRYNTEAFTNLFTKLCMEYKPSAVFVGGTANGRDFAPRFAARLETGCTSDPTELIYNEETGDIEFVEPAAGGKIMAVITIPVLRPQVGTVRPGTFQYAPVGQKKGINIVREEISFASEDIRSVLLGFSADAFDPELDIASSEVIVCVGNGLKDEVSIDRYRELARLLGGRLACTRPIIDRELLPYKLQIGQSSVVVKPKLYIGFGVSGAVNHVTGMKDSALKIAVNSNPDAPIFNYCDYGIVGDMDEICDLMIAELKARRE